jgi:hypothetical protein
MIPSFEKSNHLTNEREYSKKTLITLRETFPSLAAPPFTTVNFLSEEIRFSTLKLP